MKELPEHSWLALEAKVDLKDQIILIKISSRKYCRIQALLQDSSCGQSQHPRDSVQIWHVFSITLLATRVSIIFTLNNVRGRSEVTLVWQYGGLKVFL